MMGSLDDFLPQPKMSHGEMLAVLADANAYLRRPPQTTLEVYECIYGVMQTTPEVATQATTRVYDVLFDA